MVRCCFFFHFCGSVIFVFVVVDPAMDEMVQFGWKLIDVQRTWRKKSGIPSLEETPK